MRSALCPFILASLTLLLGGCGGEKKDRFYKGVLGDLSYVCTTKGDEIYIVDCRKSATGDLVIPEIIDGKPVTRIGKTAFRRCSSLTSITIPDSVTKTYDYPNILNSFEQLSLQDCINLTAIEVSAGNPTITSVDGVLFSKDQTTLYIYPEGKNDAAYTIPNNVTRIATGAFFQCSNLKNITIPESITSIGEWAFQDCTNLESVTIPDGVTNIGEDLFFRCKNLKTVRLGDGVTSIGLGSFCYCISLERITLPDKLEKIGKKAFLYCTSLTDITIPDSVTSIEKSAFDNCESLTHITIPDGVTSIESSTFNSCSSLTSVTIGDSVTSIGERAFSYCRSLPKITIPEKVSFVGAFAFDGCDSLTTVTFLGDTPKIKEYVFDRGVTIYRRPDAKGWGSTFRGSTVKLFDEAPSEKPIVATPPAKTGKKFPSSTKELMFGSNPVVTDKDKAFWEAAKSGNLEAVQRLLSEGVDVDIYGSTVGVDFGCTALFWAAKHNHKEVVQFLLEKDAYIDAGAGMGGAPLHIAAYEGHSEIVELLISEGANAEAKTGDGKTVIDFANEEIAALIRKTIEEKQK